MFTLIRSLKQHQLFFQQLPSLGISFVIAELFYKFHSFTIECVGFLLTWYVMDALSTTLYSKLLPKTREKANEANV